MTLTPREKEKLNVWLTRLEGVDFGCSLESRVKALETLTFFSLLNDMGEQGITPELRELCKRLGLMDLLNEYAGLRE